MQTAHRRCRVACTLGLALHILAAIACIVMAIPTSSPAIQGLGWVLLGGVPLWFIGLLVFRQHELAELEAHDLEELKREKKASGGGEALFDEQGGGAIGFRVAQNRLEWMQKWLLPVFGLISAAFLLATSAWFYSRVLAFTANLKKSGISWPPVDHPHYALIALVILTLLIFLVSRYAAGLGRVKGALLMRACGSYAFGATLVGLALTIVIGAQAYTRWAAGEQYLAWIIPAFMAILAIETLLNFVLDTYRPRTPGVEPRACFDSRLLGLMSESGGIAHSLAEAVNYQFGFQVSQTWFYQLLQRTLIPLAGVAALAVWLLTCVVIVNPNERAIIERFGAQLSPEKPLQPGLHIKAPWPMDVAQRYVTGTLHQFNVGYKLGDTPLKDKKHAENELPDPRPEIEQWSDAQHAGRDHFNFVIPPLPNRDGEAATTQSTLLADTGGAKSAPLNLIRIELVVQYRIREDQLMDFTRSVRDPHLAIRDLAWDEIGRMTGAMHIDALMGPEQLTFVESLRKKLNERAAAMKLGLEVVYTGLTNVHPDSTAAAAFRSVVVAQQGRITDIRAARVEEERILTEVAGDRRRAVLLAHAIDEVNKAELRLSAARSAGGAAAEAQPPAALQALEPQVIKSLEADFTAQRAAEEHAMIKEEFDLGVGRSSREVQTALDASNKAAETARAARAELDRGLAPIQAEVEKAGDAAAARAIIDGMLAQRAIAYWNSTIERSLVGLEGRAAVTLAQAQAGRWGSEMKALGEVSRLENERVAYDSNPPVYKARKYLEVVVNGLSNARKYMLMFDPAGRTIHTRLQLEEKALPGAKDLKTKSTN